METLKEMSEIEFRLLMLEQLCVVQTKRILELEQATGINPTASTPKHIIEQAALYGQNCLYTGVPVPTWGGNVKIVEWRNRFLKWFAHP